MRDIIDLEKYPLDKIGTPAWISLVERCKDDLAHNGMFNLENMLRPDALARMVAEVKPVMDTLSFVHKRAHNIYFMKSIPGLPDDHPALALTNTVNHTVCADQIPNSILSHIYEWAPLIIFLSATMDKDALYPMRDPLARLNVMAYREGETLNWHFDRSEFTTTLLLQAPEAGGEFVYRNNLRSADDPNYEGVARLMRGEDPNVKTMNVTPGTLNVFRGRNTAHRVNEIVGHRERMIAVFTYYEKAGAMFSREEQLGFYGRTA